MGILTDIIMGIGNKVGPLSSGPRELTLGEKLRSESAAAGVGIPKWTQLWVKAPERLHDSGGDAAN